MSEVGCNEMTEFMNRIDACVPPGKDYHIKSIISQTCFNMFSQYMCTTRFDYDDTSMHEVVRYFDNIFWEINQGYAVDFLPVLAPLYRTHLDRLSSWSVTIRNFILKRIIEKRMNLSEKRLNVDETETDFTDALLKSLAHDPDVDYNTIMFMLEDFLGGHSAIGNLVMLALGYVVLHPEIGKRIQEEADRVTNNGARKVTLFDVDQMPYTTSTIYEVLRYSSSPIVPHVATTDVAVSGYGIQKGTIVFFNNYEMNFSTKYWTKPDEFNPDRFLEPIPAPKINHTTANKSNIVSINQSILETDSVSDSASDSGVECDDTNATKVDGQHKDIKLHNNTNDIKNSSSNNNTTGEPCKLRIRKNIPYFFPFSIGKRTCIGQNLVRTFSFIMLTNILQKYDVSISDKSLVKMYPGCVAIPAETYPLALTPRNQ